MNTRSLRSFLLSFLVSSPLFGQIAITTTDVLGWYALGKGRREVASDTSKYTMNVGNTSSSAAQVWSLPTVLFTDTMLIKNAAPSSTPYANSFPSATHAQTISMSGAGFSLAYYGYVRIANDSLYELGSVTREIYGSVDTTKYDLVSRFVVKMPIALGTVITGRDSNYYGPGDYEVRTGTETVDAYGTITLPNGTFSCLRIKRTDLYKIAHVGQLLDTFTVIRFDWMTKEGHQGSATAWRKDSTSGSVRVEEVRYSAIVNVTSVGQGPATSPKSFALMQNYPNPFNPATTIEFRVAHVGSVALKIFDVLGREVAVLVNQEKSAGVYRASWNAAGMTSGMYFYRLEAIGSDGRMFVETKRMLLIR